jgi:5-hydroxyisourate hydrolase
VAQGANHPVPTISTHVLDTERGMPAAGVHVTLYRIADDGRPFRLTQALTDADGRVADLLDRPLTAGDYRLEFALTHELDDVVPGAPPQKDPFFRRLSVDLRVTDTARSYHVPLLLSSYSMTAYRGS